MKGVLLECGLRRCVVPFFLHKLYTLKAKTNLEPAEILARTILQPLQILAAAKTATTLQYCPSIVAANLLSRIANTTLRYW